MVEGQPMLSPGVRSLAAGASGPRASGLRAQGRRGLGLSGEQTPVNHGSYSVHSNQHSFTANPSIP